VRARQAADLIEHNEAERALREDREQFRWLASIVESSDDAIVSKNIDGVITSWNQGAERIFGYLAEEAIGKPITILIPPERLREEDVILSRIRHGDRIDHFDTGARATLIRLLGGDFYRAGDALASALRQWPRDGQPENARAWLEICHGRASTARQGIT
jgi:PAS domain-containing protein